MVLVAMRRMVVARVSVMQHSGLMTLLGLTIPGCAGYVFKGFKGVGNEEGDEKY